MATNLIYTPFGGVTKQTEIFCRQSNIWKPVDEVYMKHNNKWNVVYSVREPEYIVQTLYSVQQWTCPFNVTKLSTVVGRGAAGKAGGLESNNVHIISDVHAGRQVHLSEADRYAYLAWDKFPSASSGVYSLDYLKLTELYNGYQTNRVIGDFHAQPGGKSKTGLGWDRYPWREYSNGSAYQWNITGPRKQLPDTMGASSKGFGLTFYGIQGPGTVPEVTYTNVQVTPGQTYTMSIPVTGFIRIAYYG